MIIKLVYLGEDYNAHKFLQEYEQSFHARKEPQILMSNENQDLNQVRANAIARSKTLTSSFGHQANASRSGNSGCGAETLRLNLSADDAREQLPTLAPSRGYSSAREPMVHVTPTRSAGEPLCLPVPLQTERRGKRHARSSGDDQFLSKSTTFTGPIDLNWAPKSSYAELHPGASADLSYKQDKRFKWKSGTGTPRPQTTLLKIQDTFTKSSIRKKFHKQFYENNPDLRENIVNGKQHEFGGMNAQVWRGTPVDAY